MATTPTYLRAPQPVARASTRHRWRRYSRVGWGMLGIFLHLLWWDGVCRLPVLRWLQGEPLPRWQQLARRYCALATAEGDC